jgi:hypothetical protein
MWEGRKAQRWSRLDARCSAIHAEATFGRITVAISRMRWRTRESSGLAALPQVALLLALESGLYRFIRK